MHNHIYHVIIQVVSYTNKEIDIVSDLTKEVVDPSNFQENFYVETQCPLEAITKVADWMEEFYGNTEYAYLLIKSLGEKQIVLL